MKRPAQDDNCYVNEKRPFVNDKVAAAAEAAARINQKLGGVPSQIPPSSTAHVMTTEIKIPDRYVGLSTFFVYQIGTF
ncbi:unnamed protein product [Protopolystoma xenopodis]|uniref:Uncharacterized protein n=1 Tax=Protopolystoma xenopodis TaxID=117903 RepID=A0A448WPJ7_9PLAT|nr:unnamed protein product [Protopolystoma xenopodis]